MGLELFAANPQRYKWLEGETEVFIGKRRVVAAIAVDTKIRTLLEEKVEALILELQER